MSKAMIVKVFIGSLIGFVGAVVFFLVAGGLALWNDSFIMDGPDVVGVRPDPFGWVMIGLAGLAVLMMIAASLGLFVAWIGAVLNTAQLADKTWFIILLAGGLLSVGTLVTLVYVFAGPDKQPSAMAAEAREMPPQQFSAPPSPMDAGTMDQSLSTHSEPSTDRLPPPSGQQSGAEVR